MHMDGNPVRLVIYGVAAVFAGLFFALRDLAPISPPGARLRSGGVAMPASSCGATRTLNASAG
ncbi:MAG: hypothetical protein JSR45_14955 [Proteobacteria bacterium]|nr:hypothetical protein [Pseudomonadota bacterium]